MIEVSLADLAQIVGGEVFGDPHQVVSGAAVIDSRTAAPGDLFVAMVGESADGHDYVDTAREAGAVATLAQREVPGPCVVVADPLRAVADLARWSLAQLRKRTDITVVALTGSQGKTSVKDLLAHILEGDGPTVAAHGSFNNELGVPLTVLRADQTTRWLVLEMGARGLGHISYLCSIAKPDVASVLNVGSAHLGEFGSVETIARAKGEIIAALDSTGVAVLNADDHLVAEMSTLHTGRVITFGTKGDVALAQPVTLNENGHANVVLEQDGEIWSVTVPQVGFHHGINAAAAFAIALGCGLEPRVILAALASAEPRSRMRMEVVRTAGGTLILNDAYNANPESMNAGLETLVAVARARSIAVLGPMLELGAESEAQHERIGQRARELGVDRVVVVGEIARPIARAAGDIAEYCESTDVAIDTLLASLQPADTLLVKASRSITLENLVAALMSA